MEKLLKWKLKATKNNNSLNKTMNTLESLQNITEVSRCTSH